MADSGAWYSVIDKRLAEGIGVKYTGLTVTVTSFSGDKIKCDEAIVPSITVEAKTAPFELIAVCPIAGQVRELLRKQGVSEEVILGVHTLERLGYAVDVVTHELVESPGILMLLTFRLNVYACSASYPLPFSLAGS